MPSRLITTVVALLVIPPALLAQEPPPRAPQPAPADPPRLVEVNSLPPPLRLGARAEVVRTKLPVHGTVVIVPDARSFVEALSRWSLACRYPVLIDDGSAAATEDIARFVRGFVRGAPAVVVRWSAPPDVPPWPQGVPDQQERILAATARAWGAEESEDPKASLRARWAAIGLTPPGIIAASARDPAWTAALALSAGRGQPIAWVEPRRHVNAMLTIDECAALARDVEAACERSGYSWRELGDDLEAVTLCLGVPARTRLKDGDRESLATTDLVGRHGQGESAGPRWAWCGQVFGSESRAAYAAMCSLFLRPQDAWLFDGYPNEAAWAEFDATAAAEEFRAAGFDAAVRDTPGQGEREWRNAASSPVRAGIVLVNSKGRPDLFHLEPGSASPGDLPFLTVPCLVYFVHSFSAVQPGQRGTIAGRWLERGAYAYFGSVDEPYLHSYIPTPIAARRLLARAPWGAAVRADDGGAWKHAVIGDPLIVLGPRAPLSEAPLPLDGTDALAEQMKAALEAKDYAAACRALVILGRDDDAARLAMAVLNDEPAAVTGALAEAALMPLLRTGRREELVRMYTHLDPAAAADPIPRDMLWNAAWPLTASSSDVSLANLLRDNLRDDQVARDALTLAPLLERASGPGAGRSFLSGVLQRVTDARDRADLERAISGRPRR